MENSLLGSLSLQPLGAAEIMLKRAVEAAGGEFQGIQSNFDPAIWGTLVVKNPVSGEFLRISISSGDFLEEKILAKISEKIQSDTAIFQNRKIRVSVAELTKFETSLRALADEVHKILGGN